jgi:hypothetical protein
VQLRPCDQIGVLGLHTVFEHRDVMARDALAVFLPEYRIDFPVGIDRHDRDPVPPTMHHHGLRGIPSTVLIDRGGRLRHSAFGTVDDLVLGAQLGQLLAEAPITPPNRSSEPASPRLCEPGVPGVGCS